jgi:hypothetical protein
MLPQQSCHLAVSIIILTSRTEVNPGLHKRTKEEQVGRRKRIVWPSCGSQIGTRSMLAFSPDFPTRQRTTSEETCFYLPPATHNRLRRCRPKASFLLAPSRILDSRKGYDEAYRCIYTLHDLMGNALQHCVDLKATTFPDSLSWRIFCALPSAKFPEHEPRELAL